MQAVQFFLTSSDIGARMGRAAQALRLTLLGTSCVLALASAHAATPLADQPLFTNTTVPGNLLLALSVEFPTAVSVAHQGAFVAGTKYLGYFDPEKCYRYVQGTETGTDLSHFNPVGTATGRKCTASGLTDTWSGNFLNWMTMQAIDPFRWVLTGGLRAVDTDTTTILERAWATDNTNNGSDENFPPIPTSNSNALKARPSPSSTDIADHTPLDFASIKVSVRTRGNQVWFTSGSGTLTTSTTGTPTHFSQSSLPTTTTTTLYRFYARVKVCESGTGYSRESNCKQYPNGNYKPEGLLHQYAEKIRFGAFGYLNDPTDNKRDGGVLRARQKFVGPLVSNPGLASTTNSATEWDANTGVFKINPDSADASTTATVFGVTVNNSGVINYLNKFGQEQKSYKRRDPVSELYYGALRYLKKQGHISAWSNIASASDKARLIDGFPVITEWEDPVQYTCQRNFILGIGDTNTNWDYNVPGSTGGGSDEVTDPPELALDTTVNAVTATNKVGSLQGLGSSLGTTGISSGSYLIAGLAYDAHTKDIRPDLSGKQTVDTYWLDVLEFGAYASSNQYYLAAKFGGFKVPEGYDPYARTAALPEAWWRSNTDTVGPSGSTQLRPDNYYTASRPDQVVEGLTKAFASIATALRAYTTSFSTSLPQVSVSGNASYSAQFDSANWTGEIIASELSFTGTGGAPVQVQSWSFSEKLATQLAGTGWDTARRIATFNPTTGVRSGIAFRHASLTAAQKTALDTAYRTGDDSADYLNYLRGERLHEQASTATGSSKAYRTRTGLLGDVVGSKAKPVGPPSLSLSNASNPGYGTFKTTWASRPTVVYAGANDGMLHAINGTLTGTGAGAELFAYVPSAVFDGPTSTPAVNGLAALGKPDFTHYYHVNATPAAFDIDFGRTVGAPSGTNWRSVLIGGLGKGGRSYYALDITDPAGITDEASVANRVLWELSDSDLGYTYGEPVVVKTAKHGWVAIVGSGYNNPTGEGFFFIINPRTGEVLEKIGTGAGDSSNPAGLAHVNAFVLDRTDGLADAVYAGDLLGNVWRLDLRPASGSYAAPLKLATLTNGANEAQPVTTRPLIEVDPKTGRRFVLIGTGRMLDSSDIAQPSQQRFYAIVDGKSTRMGSSSDLPSGVTYPITRTKLADNTTLTDSISYDLATQIGWYIELGNAGTSGSPGWRVVTDPSAAFGIVTFAATLPNGNACSPSGISRIYAVDLGSAKSVLTGSGDALINYSTAIEGVVTDLRFFSIGGQPSLIAGSDNGSLGRPPGQFSVKGNVRRLNWREVPVGN